VSAYADPFSAWNLFGSPGPQPLQPLMDTSVAFSNRPVWVKHFQAIHRFSVDVTRGLVLLFGIGTKAVPSWDPRTRRYNLLGGLTVN
jgi:hypothetical protein